eukprot:GHRQ01002910.1.p1 GENE.GHRQ01002910.1~~GHRQ01002910.1.p1  ORF type:complete len:157 (+),score=51.41 GHRQ01002910.1:165-635(+)
MGGDPITHAVQGLISAVTPVSISSLSKDIVVLIKEDHDRVRVLYDQFKMPGTNAQQKRQLAWNIIREVSLHSCKEEEVVYPALRDVLGDLTPDHLLSEHQGEEAGTTAEAAAARRTSSLNTDIWPHTWLRALTVGNSRLHTNYLFLFSHVAYLLLN